MLNVLEAKGELKWEYGYDSENSRALFTVTGPDGESRTLHTKGAEGIAQGLANKLEICWLPVPHHGGEDQWKRTMTRIEAMRQGASPKPWEQ